MADRTRMMRLAMPEFLQKDFLHHFHTGVKGEHQEIGRTYSGYELVFTEEVWTKGYRGTYVHVRIARRVTDLQVCAEYRLVMFRPLTIFR